MFGRRIALYFALAVFAVPSLASQPQSQVLDDSRLVRLTGNTHRFATAANDRGPLDASTPLQGMKLLLKRTPAQEASLDAELDAQLDPKSPEFHKWMHAKEFGQRYGISDAGLARVTQWLEGHGFHIDAVATGRNTLTFSGSAGQLNEAFHLTMHQYQVRGEMHIANDGDPQIPAELAPYIAGFASLNDFYPEPHKSKTFVLRDMKGGKYHVITEKQAEAISKGGPKPDFGTTDPFGNSDELISPYDAATIYNYQSLWASGVTGSGQTIAITGTSDVSQSDFSTFRSTFGLPAQTLSVIQTGTDPGYNGGRGENTMDVELSGGAAPNAQIVLVVSGSTSTTPGFLTSAEYIVDKEVATIMSTSYGACELDWGTSGNQFWAANWKQADAEGISSFVSSGDSGSDSCDSQDPDPNYATSGMGVSGMASTPYATAVGGTDFFWQNSPSTYWASSNDSNGASALGYVPEVPWNSTCTSPVIYAYYGYTDGESFCNAVYENGAPYEDYYLYLDSGNGGVSDCTAPTGTTPSTCAGGYAKPSWQTGTGVPSDGKRDVPDLSLMASGGMADVPFSAWLICDSESNPCNYNTSTDTVVYQASGGTSASSPATAGIMALIQQKYGPQGLINPVLYTLFNKESLSGCVSFTVNTTSNSCIFYDITHSTNSQVCEPGTPNCNLETSTDTFGTLSGWNAATGYDLATGLGSVNVGNLYANWISTGGSAVNTTTTLSASPNPGTVNGNVTISVTVKKSSGSGTPTGSVNIVVNGTTLGSLTLSNGSASTTLSFNTAGTYQIQAQYQGDSSDNTSNSSVVNEVINAAGGTVATTTKVAGTTSVAQGGTATLTATVTKNSGSGVPTGTVTFTAAGETLYTATLSNGKAVLSGPANYPPGTYTVTASYSGDSSDAASQGTINVTVTSGKSATSTAVAASPNPVAQNAKATLTAIVSGGSTTPTGTVAFTYGSTRLGAATLSGGVGSISATAAVPQGSYGVTATYSGDSTHAASTGTVTVKVN